MFYRVFFDKDSKRPVAIFSDRRVVNDYAIYYGECTPNAALVMDKMEVNQTKDWEFLWTDPFLESEEIAVT